MQSWGLRHVACWEPSAKGKPPTALYTIFAGDLSGQGSLDGAE